VGVDIRPRCRGKIWNSRTQERKRKMRFSLPSRRTDWATGLKTVELLAGCKTEVLLRHQAGETGPWVERIDCLSTSFKGRIILQSAHEILFFGNAYRKCHPFLSS
jgi:hypothetical protein